jgi:hypothetical protein
MVSEPKSRLGARNVPQRGRSWSCFQDRICVLVLDDIGWWSSRSRPRNGQHSAQVPDLERAKQPKGDEQYGQRAHFREQRKWNTREEGEPRNYGQR